MKQSELFRQLADKMDKNDEADFAGAFLIVPPSGDAISGLSIGDADVATFWGVVKSKIEIILLEITNKDRQNQAFGRR